VVDQQHQIRLEVHARLGEREAVELLMVRILDEQLRLVPHPLEPSQPIPHRVLKKRRVPRSDTQHP
jgi:hypothetical protein